VTGQEKEASLVALLPLTFTRGGDGEFATNKKSKGEGGSRAATSARQPILRKRTKLLEVVVDDSL